MFWWAIAQTIEDGKTLGVYWVIKLTSPVYDS